MSDFLNSSLNDLGHHVSCLHISSGEQLDDIFRLHSKFVNDMRGICINLGNFFSSFVPLLDSFVIGPKNLLNPQDFVSHFNKLTVADFLNISKSEQILSDWKQLTRRYTDSGINLEGIERYTSSVELHNDLLQELVNRSSDFDRPQKYSEANTYLPLGVVKSRVNKEETKPMSEEDKKFLEGAMTSLQNHEKEISNSVSEINRISKLFSNGPHNLTEEEVKILLGSLEMLQEHFEDHPSNSSSLIRLGLLDSFTLLLHSDDDEVLSATLSIISCAFSNNESILEDASKTKLLPNLIKLKDRLKDSALEPKLISALSSSVRNCRRAEIVFITLDGLTYLKECLGRSNLKTRERAVLLFNHFLSLDRVGKLILAKLDPYRIVKMLLPVDPVNNGIQFCELSSRLVSLLLQKHRDIFTCEEVEDAVRRLDEQLASLTSLSNSNYNNIVEILSRAKQF
ncbi:hypothetical protein MACK_001397 [Theileria orientalis]|uniref:Nucleotide exchange factor SIL1 n=1 Tax=Theileria orientalis TaxID=68886 RepID=A0A976QVL5_THEOR|nr:hypothetical protein MACK_001397 [Theileria orientalis]